MKTKFIAICLTLLMCALSFAFPVTVIACGNEELITNEEVYYDVPGLIRSTGCSSTIYGTLTLRSYKNGCVSMQYKVTSDYSNCVKESGTWCLQLFDMKMPNNYIGMEIYSYTDYDDTDDMSNVVLEYTEKELMTNLDTAQLYVYGVGEITNGQVLISIEMTPIEPNIENIEMQIAGQTFTIWADYNTDAGYPLPPVIQDGSDDLENLQNIIAYQNQIIAEQHAEIEQLQAKVAELEAKASTKTEQVSNTFSSSSNLPNYDLNGDGLVTIADCIYLLRFLSEVV